MDPASRACIVLLLALMITMTASAKEVWYEDNNMGKAAGMPADFKEKFEKPDSWEDARKYIDVYLIRANTLMLPKNGIDDDFLKTQFLPVLNQAKISIALDVQGATWMSEEGKNKLVDREIELVRRLKKLGGKVDYLCLQSVLSKPLVVDGKKKPYPLVKRYQDILRYVKLMKKEFPDIKIGIIDALPSHGKDYKKPYKDLANTLKKAGFKLDHIYLDIPFEIPEQKRHGVTWKGIKDVETYVKNNIGCNFGLVCTSRTAGYESDQAYHDAVLSVLTRYSKAHGNPDQYLIMSWFPHPTATIPDQAKGNNYPVMRTVLEFGKRLSKVQK